jgi:hypothetical protein
VPAAERSHEAPVENEHNVAYIFKIGKADLAAGKIIKFEIRGWLGKLDFGHNNFPFLGVL